jgi:hypothetical protein
LLKRNRGQTVLKGQSKAGTSRPFWIRIQKLGKNWKDHRPGSGYQRGMAGLWGRGVWFGRFYYERSEAFSL